MISASTTSAHLGVILFFMAILRLPELYRDVICGQMDIAKLLRLRFDALSGAMLILLSSALPK